MLVAFRPYDFGNARWQREGRKVDRSFPKMKFHLGNRKLKNLNFDIEFRPVDWISCVIKYPVIFLLWCTIEIYPTNHAWCPLRASKPPKTWFHAIVPLFWTLSSWQYPAKISALGSPMISVLCGFLGSPSQRYSIFSYLFTYTKPLQSILFLKIVSFLIWHQLGL